MTTVAPSILQIGGSVGFAVLIVGVVALLLSWAFEEDQYDDDKH